MQRLQYLPLKDLVTADGTVTTPFELFVGSKPIVCHFRVFDVHALLRSGQSQEGDQDSH